MSVREQLFALEQFGIKLGLDQIRALLTSLQSPQRAYPSITVAGTNGKGSVAAFVEHALRAAGYRTGRYTSPHLVTIEERFAVQGEPVSAATFERAAARVMRASAELPSPPSFFEATTALALDLFRQLQVDVAVLEVGLGGRLDATTAVDPMAVAITLVDFDHQQYLGHTLPQIAAEKAAVIKPGGLAVVSDNPAEVLSVMTDHARSVGAHLVLAMNGTSSAVTMQEGHARLGLVTPRADYGTITLGLAGRHQVANAITAVRLLEEIHARGWLRVPTDAVRSALSDTRWPGRLERLRWQSIDLLLDGAHNPSGARALSSYVLESFERPLPMVIGVMKDKDLPAMVESLAPAASHFLLTAVSSQRACHPAELEGVVRERTPHIPSVVVTPPLEAVQVASRFGSPVVVAGSLYLVGEIRAQTS